MIDLAQVARTFQLKDPKHGELSGRGAANAAVAGGGGGPDVPFLMQLRAEGEFEIFGGNFDRLFPLSH